MNNGDSYGGPTEPAQTESGHMRGYIDAGANKLGSRPESYISEQINRMNGQLKRLSTLQQKLLERITPVYDSSDMCNAAGAMAAEQAAVPEPSPRTPLEESLYLMRRELDGQVDRLEYTIANIRL